MNLPVASAYRPMEARAVERIPSGGEWLYERKWDGFRCPAFRDGEAVALQSKAGQALTRYFPEITDALVALGAIRFAIDGEIVVIRDGKLAFDHLNLMRIHPAETRIRRRATETPARLLVFNLLVEDGGRELTRLPLRERRARLAAFLRRAGASATLGLTRSRPERDEAERWMREYAALGCDGIVAKLAGAAYQSGDRDAMQKVKRLRTADCVVGGFRYARGDSNEAGSLPLGLYNSSGMLDHVGFASSFTGSKRGALRKLVAPLIGGPGFTGCAPGGQSRWSTERSQEWEPLPPSLVCEVRYDHFSGGRFRHGTRFLRWRPE